MKIKELIKLAQAASKEKNPSALEAFKCVLDKFDLKDEVQKEQISETNDDNGYPDGIYVIYKDGKYELYETGMSIIGPVKYIGLKLGSKSIAIALKDASDEKTTLTIDEDKTIYIRYYQNSNDAISDWHGKENTDHLRLIGLNPRIKLNDGEYIPALGELIFINLFIKKINEALESVGGQSLDKWYWSSTELSVLDAWYMLLGNGFLSAYTKVMDQNAVRAVSAFKPMKFSKTK